MQRDNVVIATTTTGSLFLVMALGMSGDYSVNISNRAGLVSSVPLMVEVHQLPSNAIPQSSGNKLLTNI